MALCVRPFATDHRESRQARKGATAAADSGAGDRRMQGATQLDPSL